MPKPEIKKEDKEQINLKNEADKVIFDDLIGRKEWKNSKLGYLSGASLIANNFKTIGKTASNSKSNIITLWSSLFSDSDIKSLPDGGDASERFVKSMSLHNVNVNDLIRIADNTYKSFYLYLFLTLVGLSIGFYSLYISPSSDIIASSSRFIILFVCIPLMFKHSYTNWIVRKRKLGKVTEYLMSFDVLPKKIKGPI